MGVAQQTSLPGSSRERERERVSLNVSNREEGEQCTSKEKMKQFVAVMIEFYPINDCADVNVQYIFAELSSSTDLLILIEQRMT